MQPAVPIGATRRWYDRHQRLHQAVHLLGSFPKSIQSILGEGTARIAENRFRAHELMASFKSLGSEKVLALYKSKNKRREADQIPSMHKALNYFVVLADHQRLEMAGHVVELVEEVKTYLGLCRDYQQPPDLEDITWISEVYADDGKDRVKVYLDSVKLRMQGSSEGGLHTHLEQSDTDMKLKPDG